MDERKRGWGPHDWAEHDKKMRRLIDHVESIRPDMAEARDRMIRGQMEHELASIIFDVRNGRGYDDPTD